MELWLGLLLVALFFFMYIKGREQHRGMRERRRKILDRYSDFEGNYKPDDDNSSE